MFREQSFLGTGVNGAGIFEIEIAGIEKNGERNESMGLGFIG